MHNIKIQKIIKADKMFLGSFPLMEWDYLVLLQFKKIANDNIKALCKQLKNDEAVLIWFCLRSNASD